MPATDSLRKRANRFKRYKELIHKQPNLRRDTIAKKLRCLEIEVTAMKQRLEAETAAKERIARAAKRPPLLLDKKGKPAKGKRKKKDRW